ncbi:hypothetical protein Hanom_Chr05g00416891 [Helianthus anomalus]
MRTLHDVASLLMSFVNTTVTRKDLLTILHLRLETHPITTVSRSVEHMNFRHIFRCFTDHSISSEKVQARPNRSYGKV